MSKFNHIAVAFVFLLCGRMSKLRFNITYWEETIHTSNTQHIEMVLFSQSNEQYDSCEIGNMSNTGVDQSCKFSKANLSRTVYPSFIKERCSTDSFIHQIGFSGIIKSDFICKLTIKWSDAIGNIFDFI